VGAAALPQHGVGCRRSVSRDDVVRPIRFQRTAQLVEQIEKLGVDRLFLVDPEVAQFAAAAASAPQPRNDRRVKLFCASG
jgi:hypothetical protein